MKVPLTCKSCGFSADYDQARAADPCHGFENIVMECPECQTRHAAVLSDDGWLLGMEPVTS